MSIPVAHLNIQGFDVAIFAARPNMDTASACAAALEQLTARARNVGLKVDKSALAYSYGSGVRYYGTPDLVRYLQNNGVAHWTHALTA